MARALVGTLHRIGDREVLLTAISFSELADMVMLGDIITKPEREGITQRQLNPSRVKNQIVPYLHTPGWFFPPLVFSFRVSPGDSLSRHFFKHENSFGGSLILESGAPLRVLDGQHRLEAIIRCAHLPELKNTEMPVVIVSTSGLDDDRRLFVDINHNAQQVTRDLITLFNNVDAMEIVSASRYLPYVISYGHRAINAKYRRIQRERGGHASVWQGLGIIDRLLELIPPSRTGLIIDDYVRLIDNVVFEGVPYLKDIAEGLRRRQDISKQYVSTSSALFLGICKMIVEEIQPSYKDWERVALRFLKSLDYRLENPLWSSIVAPKFTGGKVVFSIGRGNNLVAHEVAERLKQEFRSRTSRKNHSTQEG